MNYVNPDKGNSKSETKSELSGYGWIRVMPNDKQFGADVLLTDLQVRMRHLSKRLSHKRFINDSH